jgi:hypothetical protein
VSLTVSDPQTGRASQNLALLLPALALLLMLVVMLYYLPLSADVAPDEARLMWLVRDVVDIQPAPPRELARNLLQNVTSVVDRSREAGIFPLYPLILEGWTWLVGDSIEMARVLTMLIIMVGLALFYRLIRRIVPMLALPVALAAALLVMLVLLNGVRRDWNSVISPYLNTRNPLHPVLTAFTPDSVPGYYDHRYGLRQGVAVDLAWREFSPDEIAVIVEKLMPGETPIWIIMTDDSSIAEQVIAILSESHTLGYSDQIRDIIFYRFDVTTSTD